MCFIFILFHLKGVILNDTVKPVLVASSLKQATCIKQACILFSKWANALKCTCIKQAPILRKQILIIPGACLLQVGLYEYNYGVNLV